MADQQENNKLFLEKELLSPYTYFSQMEGKRRHLKLFYAFNHWLQVPDEKLIPVMDMIHMLFVSASMCDDIQDGTRIRGVLPAAHCVYGIPLTINASYHSFLLILEKASKLCPEAYKIIIEEYVEVFRGQGTEIYWRDNLICPTEEQFCIMAKQKTGRFFIILIRLIQLFSENKTDYSKLVLTLSTFIQINDDYCNLNHQEGLEGWPEAENKKVHYDTRFCEDITEGKFTLPVIHAMQTEYADQIRNILRQRTRDVNLKKYCVSLLEKAGSLQHTREAMAQLDRDVRVEVARHGGNAELEAILDQFVVDWET